MKTLSQNKEEVSAIKGSTSSWSLVQVNLSLLAFDLNISSFQDITLLETVEQCGLHSWDEVARILETNFGTVAPQQLEEHFQW